MPERDGDDLRDRSADHEQREAEVALGEVDRQVDVDERRGRHGEPKPAEQRRRIAEVSAERPDEQTLRNEREQPARAQRQHERHSGAREQDPA